MKDIKQTDEYSVLQLVKRIYVDEPNAGKSSSK